MPRLLALLKEVLSHSGRVPVISDDRRLSALIRQQLDLVPEQHTSTPLVRRTLPMKPHAQSAPDAQLVREQWQLLASLTNEAMPPDDVDLHGIQAATESLLDERQKRIGAFEGDQAVRRMGLARTYAL